MELQGDCDYCCNLLVTNFFNSRANYLRAQLYIYTYQRIFFTAAGVGYIEVFCQKYDAKLSVDELLAQKKMIMATLECEKMTSHKEVAAHIFATLNNLLIDKGKKLNAQDERNLAKIIEDICSSKHLIASIMHKRLGDQLSHYFLKGYLLNPLVTQAKLYGVQTELEQLGKEMLPLLRHHVKVHGRLH